MDSIVKKLSEIETAAASIVEHAESQKEVLEQEMAEKRREFDEALNADTQKKLDDIRSQLESRMKKELKEQEQTSENIIRSYKEEFRARSEEYAHEILTHITGVV